MSPECGDLFELNGRRRNTASSTLLAIYWPETLAPSYDLLVLMHSTGPLPVVPTIPKYDGQSLKLRKSDANELSDQLFVASDEVFEGDNKMTDT